MHTGHWSGGQAAASQGRHRFAVSSGDEVGKVSAIPSNAPKVGCVLNTTSILTNHGGHHPMSSSAISPLIERSAIRPTAPDDLISLGAVIDRTGLFPSELLPGMAQGAFNGTAPEDIWLTLHLERPVGVAYCAPERLTNGTWNLLLIAVDPAHQGLGLGARLLAHVERLLIDRGGRMLLVETSGLPEFERTRAFYVKNCYAVEARLRDYYDAGEDKVVFMKTLSKG
jgi:GNAT superfamily N-acetyltransferase